MSKRTGISALIMVSLLALVTFGLTSCMPGADLRAKRDQDARRTAQMNKLLGRGVNLGNALEAPREGEWGVTLKEEYFDIIKQAGFNSIRLPVRWSAHAMAEKPYTIDHNFFKRIDWAVNCAISRNMPIMVNVQQYVELYTDPNAHRERFIALWKQIAEHYKDYPDKLLLELFNEPDDALTPELWNDFLKDTLAVVRESNPNRIVVIDPARDSIPSSLKFLKIPENDRNIIVSVHYYFPLAFTHQGAPWMAKKYDPNSWMGTKGDNRRV
jgi:endoglucanase